MEEVQLFKSKKIRTILYNGITYFSVVDVIEALTESKNPRNYWSTLKKREQKASGVQLSTFCQQLKLKSTDNRRYLTDCADKKGLLRIIQSIPSRKAEPFRLWLAELGGRELDEKTNKRLVARRKLQETQERLFEKVKDRGVDKNGFKRVVASGDKALFGEKDINEVYGIEDDANPDDHMNTLLLMGKGFASEITDHNISQFDKKGEGEITDEHKNSNQAVREILIRETKVKPEDLPPEENIKLINEGGKKG